MRPLVLLLTGVLLLGGCTLAPKYERNPEKVPQDYRFQSLEGQPQPQLNTLADLSWWEIFQDPVLQELIRNALVANYDLRPAADRLAEARALVGVSRSAWLPQVGGVALYQRERLSETSNPPASPISGFHTESGFCVIIAPDWPNWGIPATNPPIAAPHRIASLRATERPNRPITPETTAPNMPPTRIPITWLFRIPAIGSPIFTR